MKINSIQHLLDTLGPPPAEVCLDWAWQLVNLAEESPSGMEADRRSQRPHSLAAASWSAVLIDAQGQLSLARQSTSEYDEQSIADLVHQLMEWSGSAVNSALLTPDLARQATLSGSVAALEEQRRSLSQFIDTLQWDAQPAHQVDSSTLSIAEQLTEAAEAQASLQYASCNTSNAEPPSAPVGSTRLPKQKAKKRIPPVMLWSGAALGLTAAVSLVLVFWSSGKQDDGSASNLAALQSADTTATNPAKNKSTAPQRSPADSGGKGSSNQTGLMVDSAEELTTLAATLENTAVNGPSELSVENPLPSTPADTLSNLGSVAPRLDSPISPSVDRAVDATASQLESAAESIAK